ncbi:Coenzyme F420 hydrogenase/dehydrogenase, beta subunit C-terminal domain [Syntrophomonas erecta]
MIELIDLSSFESKSKCCGCRACESICPVGAISMHEDMEGFVYPHVNMQICIDCDLCEKVCPFINLETNQQSKYAEACYSKDAVIRNNASSGGVFELLARDIIADNGVVFGAAFDKQLTLKHMDVDNLLDLNKLCKSKYIQSDTNGTFAKVKEFLLEDKKVMFVGTPCQVSGLKNYLGKPFDHLLTVDFICHGVPSDKMFKSYKEAEEKIRGAKMVSFSFRVKDGKVKHINGYSYTMNKDGKLKEYKGMFFDNPFYFGFKKSLILRSSCYSCLYCTPERVSDITLADFWGIEDYLSHIDFNKGVSMVLVNSNKGQFAMNKLRESIDSYQFGIDVAIKCNHCLSSPTELPKNREKLMQDYQNMPFNEFAKRHIMSKKMMIYKLYYALPITIRKIVMKKFKGIGYV